MNRRGFFKMLGLGAAAVAIVSVLDKLAPPPAEYATYIMGKEAVGSHRYARTSIVAQPEKSQMPNGEIPGWASYRYHMTVSMPPNSRQRIRYIDAVTS